MGGDGSVESFGEEGKMKGLIIFVSAGGTGTPKGNHLLSAVSSSGMMSGNTDVPMCKWSMAISANVCCPSSAGVPFGGVWPFENVENM